MLHPSTDNGVMPKSSDKSRKIIRPPKEDASALPSAPDSERHGWGEDPHDGRRDRDWYENERPPHHGD